MSRKERHDAFIDINAVEKASEHVALIPAGHGENGDANARLIAAAPDLHQALLDAPEMDSWADMTVDEMRESMRGYVDWFHGQRGLAIQKATGGDA